MVPCFTVVKVHTGSNMVAPSRVTTTVVAVAVVGLLEAPKAVNLVTF